MRTSPPVPAGAFRSGGTSIDATNQIPSWDPRANSSSVPPKGAGTYGNKRTRGQFYEEPLGELYGIQGIDTWDRMRRTDAMVKALLRVVFLPLLSAEWKVELGGIDAKEAGGEAKTPEQLQAEKIRSFVERALFRKADRKFRKMIAESLLYLPYGFMVQYVALKMEKDDDGQPRAFLKDLYMRHPRSILSSASPWQFVGDRLIGITQTDVYNSMAPVTLAREEVLLLSNDQEGGNYEGISLLRPLYRPYIAKGRLINILFSGLERLAVGIVVAKKGLVGDLSGRQEKLFEAGENVRSGEAATIVLENDEELDTLHGELKAEELQSTIKFQNEEMAKAVGAEFLELGLAGAGGSYALSADKTDLYLIGEEAIGLDLAAGIEQDIVRRLVRLNFGQDALRYCPTLRPIIQKETRAAIADMWLKLIQGNVITMSEEDEDTARRETGLPIRTLPRPSPEEQIAMEAKAKAAASPPGGAGNNPTGGNQPPSAQKKPAPASQPAHPQRKAA